jgi:hypothetical protein
MPSGGARNRSGPQPDPNSLKSAKIGYTLTALPSQGYSGPVPAWPLEGQTTREAAVWAEAWTTPQACAWSTQSWRYRTIAMWVRWSVRMEDSDATAAIATAVLRLADQIGLTPAGLKENGWKVATDEVGARRSAPAAAGTSARDRLRSVRGGQAAG